MKARRKELNQWLKRGEEDEVHLIGGFRMINFNKGCWMKLAVGVGLLGLVYFSYGLSENGRLIRDYGFYSSGISDNEVKSIWRQSAFLAFWASFWRPRFFNKEGRL